MEARTFGEPSANRGRLVRTVVIQNQVYVERLRHGLIDGVEKLTEFHAPVPPVELADDFPGLDIQGGEQRSSAVPRVVVSTAFHLAGAQGQQRLGSVQSLDLRFLIHAQHQTAVSPTMSRTLSMNSGSFDSLKVSLRCGWSAKARQMRFAVLRLSPDSLASERVLQWGGVFGRRFQGHREHALDFGIAHLAWRTGTRFI